FGKFFDDSRDNIDDNQSENAGGGSSNDSFWGVIVVGNAATDAQGEWQYWNGSAWTAIPSGDGISDNNGLLLNSDTALQFVPRANWNGEPGELTVRLVENNANADSSDTTFDFTSGTTVNLSKTGGTGGYSQVSDNTVTLGTKVNAVNDAPEA